MSRIENKRLFEEIFAELAVGNGRPFISSLAEDIRWTIFGTTAWSKVFEGKQAVEAELLGPLRAQFAEPYRASLKAIIAEDDRIVAEFEGQMTTKAGKAYNNTYCWVCRVAEGRIKELNEYMDTELVATALEPPPAK